MRYKSKLGGTAGLTQTGIPHGAITDLNISAGAFRLWAYLAKEGSELYWSEVSDEQLQEELGISMSVLNRRRAELRRNGYLVTERVGSRNWEAWLTIPGALA